MLTLPVDRDTEVASCAWCSAEKQVFVGTGEGLCCKSCVDTLAWHCDDCGDDVVTVAADTESGPELLCAKCREYVEPIRCDECREHIDRGEVVRHDEGVVCRGCAEDDDCRSCGGSGGGDYAGIRCLVCRGTGRRR